MSINLVPLTYKTRNYFPLGANNFLLANAGQQILQDQVRVNLTFDFESSADEPVQINDEFSFKSIGFNWGDKGFVIGDSVSITYSLDGGGATVNGAIRTILDIQGNLMYFSDFIALTSVYSGALMPMSAGSGSSNSTLKIDNLTRSLPEQMEIYHNIINNASNPNKNSLIDGEQNRFLGEDVDAMAPSDTITLFQQGNKSGGAYILAELTRTADLSDGRKSFLVFFTYFTTWKFEDSTFNKPSYLTGQQSLKPCYFVKAFPETNNPNAGLSINGYGFNNGNTGWYEENYNGGEQDFLLKFLTITDSTGQVINEIDHNQECTITGEITGPAVLKDFIEGEFYIIPPESEWKNNEFGFHQNILLASFTANLAGAIDSNSYGKNSALINSSDEAITLLTAGGVLDFTFKLTPNSQFTDYINGLQEQERRYRISLNVESDGGTDNDNNAVSKILKEGILTAAPIPDQPFDEVVFSGFYNHWQDIDTGVSEQDYNGCTEDDFVFKTKFNLDKNVLWEQMNLSVEVVRDSDGSSFILDSKTFNFNAFTMDSDGVIQFVGSPSSQFVQQFLEAPERNEIKIFNTGVDTASTYEVQVNWSLMANWRYWQLQSNAFLDFFDTTLPNNGKNKEWIRYLEIAGFSIKLFSRLVRDGIAYFWVNQINLQDYDDSPTITSLPTVYIDDQGIIQTVLVSGQDMIIRTDHVLSSGVWDQNDTEGWISQRGFEEDPNKRISTKWDWTSQSSPLKPKAGQTKAELTFPSADIARIECLVETNLVDVNKATFVGRIESPSAPSCQHPIDYVFDYIESNATNDSEIVQVYNNLLNQVDATEKNICCPTCSNLYSSIFGNLTVYAIGSKADIDLLVSTSVDDPDDVCCIDGYKETYAFPRCDVDFEAHIAEINALLDGDVAFIDNTLIPTQMNSYTGTTELELIKARLQALTTDEEIRYDLWREIIERGLMMRCKEDGTKYLSRI